MGTAVYQKLFSVFSGLARILSGTSTEDAQLQPLLSGWRSQIDFKSE